MQTITPPKINMINALQGVASQSHPLLARLTKEISDRPHAKYDRTHNRHNRGN